MSDEVNTEAQLRAARQLALHLRQRPEDSQRSPEELAQRFGLPATFVQNVLSGVSSPARRVEPWFPRVDLSFLIRAYRSANRLFDRLTRNPVLFVLITTAICIAIGFFVEGSSDIRVGIRRVGMASDGLFTLVASIVAFGMHLTVFFKRKMVRFALLSGLGVWILLSVVFMVSMWLDMQSQPQGVLVGLLLAMSFAMLVVCSVYAAIGAAAAVLGAYLDMLRNNLREDRMSRQELLEQYFQLQERLDASKALTPAESIFDSDIAKALINTGPLWALLIGLLLNTIMVVLQIASGIDVGGSRSLNWAVYAQLVLTVITLVSYVGTGFFAKNGWYAVIQSFAISVGGLLPLVVGIRYFNLKTLAQSVSPLGFVAATAGYAIVSLFGALGGVVQRRAAKELNLAQNDPASIVAEMIRIQWKLSDRQGSVCVMVVDAAKSAEMKAYADPLAVEYSFREYQNLLEYLTLNLNGRVHSTAGDGAVIAFETAVEAFTAAKRIQTDIERFNREDNRLQLPFRLRVGLHMGEVVGNLEEVEFTEVIDIAAHVQAAAPVGGIAVTETVAEHLPVEEFVPLAKQIDGQNVLLALNPTVDKPWQPYST
jgi:class 3 adenylate cyclase